MVGLFGGDFERGRHPFLLVGCFFLPWFSYQKIWGGRGLRPQCPSCLYAIAIGLGAYTCILVIAVRRMKFLLLLLLLLLFLFLLTLAYLLKILRILCLAFLLPLLLSLHHILHLNHHLHHILNLLCHLHLYRFHLHRLHLHRFLHLYFLKNLLKTNPSCKRFLPSCPLSGSGGTQGGGEGVSPPPPKLTPAGLN